MNIYKTSDIKISTDSVGYMTATHPQHGILIDSAFYDTRQTCRRDAVKALREIQNNKEVTL
jgi:hypothetical protein